MQGHHTTNVEDSSWRRPQATTSKNDYEEVVTESLRFQTTEKKDNIEIIYVSLTNQMLVHNQIHIPHAMRISETKAVADEEWDKWQNLLAGDESQVIM